MRDNLIKEQYTMFGNFVCLICFVTNLSQAPFFVENGLTRYISIPMWVLLGGICVLKKTNVCIDRIKVQLVISVLFALYYMVATVFNESFMESALPYPIFLSLFVLVVGTMSGKYFNGTDLQHIVSYYIFSGIIVCINVYFTYIHGKSITGRFYLYSSKNSVSQILLTTWILILLLKFVNCGSLKKIMYGCALAFLTWTMVALKSRATIIAIPIVMVWVLLHAKQNKKARNIIFLICLVFVILMLNDEIREIFMNDILFGGRDSSDLNAISSGRSDEWATFPGDFSENWLWGKGREKRESLILTSLLEFGVVGGGMIISLAISPIIWGITKLRKMHSMYLVFTSLSIAYFLNGIFEQLAPFGPGVKCYFLWFMFGILAADRHEKM